MGIIKPCPVPWCGRADTGIPFHPIIDGTHMYHVECHWCECKTNWFSTPQEAVAAWNTRPREMTEDELEAVEYLAQLAGTKQREILQALLRRYGR